MIARRGLGYLLLVAGLVVLPGSAAAGEPSWRAEPNLATTLGQRSDPIPEKLGLHLAGLASGRVPRGSQRLLRLDRGRVLVDAVSSGPPAALRRRLEALGLQRGATAGRVVSGWLPVAALERAGASPALQFMRPAAAMTRRGAATSQGDVALGAAAARLDYGVDGAGVLVGTLSDSYDCLAGAADDVLSDDLPVGILVLAEEAGCGSGTDEGRAMMQIIHDLAPGTQQLFHTAFNGQADFALGIQALADAGVQIINDDVIYFAEPMFQDGIIAQAVDAVRAAGVTYFSAAGNEADDSYEAAFESSGIAGAFPGNDTHDFDPGPDIDHRQDVRIPIDGVAIVVLQWDEPFFSVSGLPGSQNDLELVLLSADGNDLLAAAADRNFRRDPVEVLVYENPGPDTDFQLQIELARGTAPALLKLVYFGDVAATEYVSGSPSLYGHANAAGAFATAAARYDRTPAFGVSPPRVESFSSLGGVPILFDIDGNRVAQIRAQPAFTAADGGDTTFFGFDYEPNGLPNFFGTSAAAPHAAAVAALLKAFDAALTPEQIGDVLKATALDMEATGTDLRTGAGLIQADAALAAIAPIPDSDADGVSDDLDNCLLRPNGPAQPDAGGNSQRDADGDGFGNLCDADLNNDGFVNFGDLAAFKASFGSSDPIADFDGDGLVNFADLAILKGAFGKAPGPSALAP